MEMQKRNYKNDELKVEINCYIDKKMKYGSMEKK